MIIKKKMLIVVLVLCLSLCPARAFAEETGVVDSDSRSPCQAGEDGVPAPAAEGTAIEGSNLSYTLVNGISCPSAAQAGCRLGAPLHHMRLGTGTQIPSERW